MKSRDNKLFGEVKKDALSGLAKTEFNLGNPDKAKKLLFRYQVLRPLVADSYYLLGRIFEKEKDFERSAMFYKDAIRLGYGPIEPMSRLLNIAAYLKEKNEAIDYVYARYKNFKRWFISEKKSRLKNIKKFKNSVKFEKKMRSLEKRLKIREG